MIVYYAYIVRYYYYRQNVWSFYRYYYTAFSGFVICTLLSIERLRIIASPRFCVYL
jgi:hypothetical protein